MGKTFIKKLIWKNCILHITFSLITKKNIAQKGKVLLSNREENLVKEIGNIEMTHVKQKGEKLIYIFEGKLFFEDSQWSTLKEGIYDLFFTFYDIDGKLKFHKKIGRPPYWVEFFLKEITINTNHDVRVIQPYFTFKHKNLAFEVVTIPKSSYNYWQKISKRKCWLYNLWRKNDIWLVGEKSGQANDTGLAFYKYMREKHPEKKVYYVVRPGAPGVEKLVNDPNVIEFYSKKHILFSLIAKKIICSHHPHYLYPLKTRSFLKQMRASLVFLQHGVLGMKNMYQTYGYKQNNFYVDLFFVSSNYERNYVIKDLKYPSHIVHVTGLSRFDTLFQKDTQLKRQIMIMPTWRDWIHTHDQFFSSEYFVRYRQLLTDRRLIEILEKFHLNVIFVIHPNMKKYLEEFRKLIKGNIKIVDNTNIQQYVKESLLLITDYSSVGFDFSFLNKPVIYYQFDREKFLGKSKSHINVDEDLPGYIVFQYDELINTLENVAESGFKNRESNYKKAQKFLAYYDQNNNERIYNVLIHTHRNKAIKEGRTYRKAIQYVKFTINKLSRKILNRLT